MPAPRQHPGRERWEFANAMPINIRAQQPRDYCTAMCMRQGAMFLGPVLPSWAWGLIMPVRQCTAAGHRQEIAPGQGTMILHVFTLAHFHESIDLN